MLFKNLLTVAATAAVASAEDVYLYVKSDDASIDGNSLGYPHEGAGLNYFFLGTGAASALTYDSENKTITYPIGSGFYEYFTTYGSYVGLMVTGPGADITFDDNNTLLYNGTSENFYACKDTNDPYQYSKEQYEVMYYTSDAPSGCISLTIVNEPNASSSASPSSSTATTTTESTSSSATDSSTPSASTYTGAANHYAPAGAAAILAGAAAALF